MPMYFFAIVQQLCTFKKIKGIHNFQGILNWILQMYYHYCRKQQKEKRNKKEKKGNSGVYWMRCCYLFLGFSLFTSFCITYTFLNNNVFPVLSTPLKYLTFSTSQVISAYAANSFFFKFENSSLRVKHRYHNLYITLCLQKNFNLHFFESF